MHHDWESNPDCDGGEEVCERSPVGGVDGIDEVEGGLGVRKGGGKCVRVKRLRNSTKGERHPSGGDPTSAPDQRAAEVDDPGGGGSKSAGGDPRLGGDLIGDADTQALVGDVVGKSEVTSASSEVDLRDMVDFDDAGSGAERFRPEYEYYNGWSEGDNVVLLRRDPITGRRIKEVHPFEWYFYVRREEYDRVSRDKWAWLARRHARKVVPDPKFPERYVRVYVRNSVRKLDLDRIFRGIGDPEWGPKWAVPLFLGERPRSLRLPRDRSTWTDLHHTMNWCVRNGMEPLEADLSPKQRFLTDFDVRIQAKYRIGFFDLETDDSVGGFDRKEEARILSVAWEGDRADEDPKDRGFILLREETDEAERELLLQFKRRCLEKYDVVVAWNGAGFDFPVLINRFRLCGIRVEWRRYLFLDLLPIFKRHFVRGGSKATSFALDSIGDKVLGMRKLDWRKIFRERNPEVSATFLNLYRYEPKLLEEYNRYDVEITRKLEEFTGFAAIEQLFCRISSGFINDLQIMTKVDQLLLKKGFKEGHHFPTRYWTKSDPERYEGAYVFDPILGMHENVCVFDFKSLYPSMIRAFNISPETIVREEDRDKFDSEQMCRIPYVTLDRGDEEESVEVRKGGTTFRTDREGFISQMYERTLERRKKYTELQGKRLNECGTTQDDLYLLYYRLAYSFKRLGLSFYGDLGNPKSRYYDIDLAEAVTLSGQYFIRKTNEYAEECGFVAIYGDSITSERCVVVQDDRERVRVEPIERLFEELREKFGSIIRNDGKEVVEVLNWKALSIDDSNNSVWSKLGGLVRHKTEKLIYRLSTPEGIVETTEDHGIIVQKSNKLIQLSPIDIFKSNFELLCVDIAEFKKLKDIDIFNEIGFYERKYERRVNREKILKSARVSLCADEEFIRIVFDGIKFSPTERIRFRRKYIVGTSEMDDLLDLLGIFCAEGSVSFVNNRYSEASISIYNKDEIKYFASAYWRLAPTQKGDGITDNGRKLQMRSELLSTVFGRLCGVGCEGKRVPNFVFSLPDRERRRFLDAYLRGDGSYWRDRKSVGNKDDHDGYESESVSLELTSGISYLSRSLGDDHSIRLPRKLPSGKTSWGIRTKKIWNRERNYSGRSKKSKPRLERIDYDGYVYDLSVPETGRFVEALGCVALHNTDSIFIQLANKDEKWNNDELRLNVLISRAEKFVAYCQERYVKILEEHGCRLEWNSVYLEFEDIHDRIFFTSKKRYAGKQMYHKGELTSHVEVKGFEVMRSDQSQVTQDLQRRILDAVLLENISAEELERRIVKPEFDRVASGKLTVDEVTISKGISRDPDRYKAKMLHVDLAREIRDHGREFHLGMKVEYVVTGSKPKLSGVLASEFAEDPLLTYDAVYYWDNVIYPPTLRILEVVYPNVDWRGFLLEVMRRRKVLLDRYRRWLIDPKNVSKAVDQIRANVGNILGPNELTELRAVPRVRTLRLDEIG